MSDAALVMDKVRAYLAESDLRVDLTEDGYAVPYESTVVFVNVIDQSDMERVIVHMYSPVLRDIDPSPDLFQYIATANRYFFGNLLYETESNLLVYTYSLLGDYLDKDELYNALRSVAFTADDLDDELQAKFGGKRVIDE